MPARLPTASSKALKERPDLREAGLGVEHAANGQRMARAEFLPKVNAFSSWEEDNQTFLDAGGQQLDGSAPA